MGRHFRPSEASRWIACPASVAICEKLPVPEGGPAALKGTTAHHLAELCLRYGELDASSYERETCDTTGLEYTSEMVDAVNVYLDEVWKYAGKPDAIFYVESEEMAFKQDDDTCGGTTDCVVVEPETLRIFDYKNGAGVVVPVEENKQLLSYALGQFYKHGGKFRKIVLTVVQPNARDAGETRGVKTWECDAITLAEFEAEARAAIIEARSPNARCVPGDHCTFCPAKKFAKCPAQNKLFADVFEEIEPMPALENVPSTELGERLQRAYAVKAYVEAIIAFAEDEARKGKMPSGFKWVLGTGRRGWTQTDAQTVATIKERLGVDVSEVSCPSPAAVEKLLGKKKEITSALADLIVKSPGKPKLVVEAHKGAAISLDEVNRSASAAFEDVE